MGQIRMVSHSTGPSLSVTWNATKDLAIKDERLGVQAQLASWISLMVNNLARGRNCCIHSHLKSLLALSTVMSQWSWILVSIDDVQI